MATVEEAQRQQEVLKHLVAGEKIGLDCSRLEGGYGHAGFTTTRQFFGYITLSLEVRITEDEDGYEDAEYGLFIEDDDQEFQITGWNKWYYSIEAIKVLIESDFEINML